MLFWSYLDSAPALDSDQITAVHKSLLNTVTSKTKHKAYSMVSQITIDVHRVCVNISSTLSDFDLIVLNALGLIRRSNTGS